MRAASFQALEVTLDLLYELIRDYFASTYKDKAMHAEPRDAGANTPYHCLPTHTVAIR